LGRERTQNKPSGKNPSPESKNMQVRTLAATNKTGKKVEKKMAMLQFPPNKVQPDLAGKKTPMYATYPDSAHQRCRFLEGCQREDANYLHQKPLLQRRKITHWIVRVEWLGEGEDFDTNVVTKSEEVFHRRVHKNSGFPEEPTRRGGQRASA